MKSLAEVLRQKETEFQNLQREVEALRLAVRLCSEDGEAGRSEPVRAESIASGVRPLRGASVEPEKVVKQFP